MTTQWQEATVLSGFRFNGKSAGAIGKESTIKATGRFLKLTDREALESVYEEYREVFPVTPLMSAAEIQAVLAASKNAKAKSFKPEDFFDNLIVRKIQATGFIEQVNRK